MRSSISSFGQPTLLCTGPSATGAIGWKPEKEQGKSQRSEVKSVAGQRVLCARRLRAVWWYGMGMAMNKVTFTLDEATIERLQQAAACLALPKSEVVREAILDLSERIGRLSERERLNLLRTFDELVPRIPKRGDLQVEQELKAIR